MLHRNPFKTKLCDKKWKRIKQPFFSDNHHSRFKLSADFVYKNWADKEVVKIKRKADTEIQNRNSNRRKKCIFELKTGKDLVNNEEQ